jgi:hypothetical protein
MSVVGGPAVFLGFFFSRTFSPRIGEAACVLRSLNPTDVAVQNSSYLIASAGLQDTTGSSAVFLGELRPRKSHRPRRYFIPHANVTCKKLLSLFVIDE